MLNKIKALQAAEISEILNSPELSRFVLTVYNNLFDNKNKRFCATAIAEFSKIIKTKGLQKLEEMAKQKKYIMKEGIIIVDYETREKYSASTITDKQACELLKKYPKLADKFEVIPTTK